MLFRSGVVENTALAYLVLREMGYEPKDAAGALGALTGIERRLHFLKMQGNEVFKHAVRCMCDAGQRVLERNGLKVEDVKWVVPHQANMRIISAISDRMHLPLDRFCINLDRVGNMSGASVPVALDEAVRDGRVQNGDLVLFVAFGGGFTWGATVMEWNNGR